MYRLMQPSDKAAVLALWQRERGESEEFAANAVERFAGQQNVYVAEENDAIAAVALAVPVTLQGRQGSYLYGLCGQGQFDPGRPAGLPVRAAEAAGRRLYRGRARHPGAGRSAAGQGLCPRLCIALPAAEVARNLWSQAEFDSVTAKKLCELREKFWPDTVQFTPERMAVVLGDLYSRGATIVANERGYGVYFRKEDTLYFVELMAEDDRAAEVLMEAAREKEVIVEKAVITVGAAQTLFLGEGTRQEYGMIRFDGEPFDVSESYMRLMLEG